MGVDGVTVSGMCRAPLAGEFFRLVGRLEDPSVAAVSRKEAMRWAAWARLNLDPWSDDLHGLLERATQLEDCERLVIEHVFNSAGFSWWSEPLDRGRQLFLGSSADGSLTPSGGGGCTSAWEAYAQRTTGWVMTSTITAGDRCGLDEIVDLKLGDWDPPNPMPRQLLQVDESARVYELACAEDWRGLVERYPTSAAVDAPMGPCISVDWAAASVEWDAVHLSLAGLLLASYVASEVPGGLTYLWSWDTEQTLWLNQRWTVVSSPPVREADVHAP